MLSARAREKCEQKQPPFSSYVYVWVGVFRFSHNRWHKYKQKDPCWVVCVCGWVKSEKRGGVRWEGKPTPIETSKYEHDLKVVGEKCEGVEGSERTMALCRKGELCEL